MELKKNPNADVDKVRASVFAGGLVFALAAIAVIFQLTFYEYSYGTMAGTNFEVEEEEDMIIVPPDVKPPPPPPKPTVVIEIVEDDEEIEEEELEIEEEVEEDTEVEFIEEEEEEVVEESIFKIVEKMPEFPGGEEALLKYLGKNTKYPPMAKDAGISGKVFVTFVVEKDGSISDVKLLRKIGGGCDEEALRVVKNMPKWSPGKQRGKNVRVQFNLPINFILR